MEREPLGLTTWASHEAVTRNARQAGDRPLNTGPDPHLRHQSNLQMVNSLIPCALVSHGPLMAVDPDLGRVGEVGADLDKRRPELLIPQVEVVAGHPAVGLVEGEPRDAVGGVALSAGEHTRVLLRDTDRSHPGPAGRGLRDDVGPHLLDLAVGLGEPDNRDVLVVSEAADRLRNTVPILSKIAGDGIGFPRCAVRKLTTCPPTCRLFTQAL